MHKQHRILIGTDGSRTAQAALANALKFPWPESARARAVIARENSDWLPAYSEQARAAVEHSFEAAVDTARVALTQRWPG